jgi:hypothetical protein
MANRAKYDSGADAIIATKRRGSPRALAAFAAPILLFS